MVVSASIEWAAEHDTNRQLAFSHNCAEADGQDVLFASGTIQYLDHAFRDLIASLPSPPRHILITTLPLHHEHSFFTIQNMGTLYCAYRIDAEATFVAQLKEIGYTVRDQWDQPDRQCVISFHPECRVDKYHGFLFSRAGA